ncbi:MAG TPA: T9SS type A sorting domain-containing protein, partial [Saprospiraceae bacterium]|nr:T9SS type A sorting domain-containing protein [Saprospiraceae bacterium]
DCMITVNVQDKLPPQIICPSDLTISCEFPFTAENLDVFGTVALSEDDREQICIDDPGYPGNPGLHCIGIDGLATDNCSVTISETASININNCGLGTILRTFTATDAGGLTNSCVQTISIINYDPFTEEDDIIWPENLTTFNICEIDSLDPEDLDPLYSEPILNEGPCDLTAFTYHDDVFDFSNNDQACFKILRTWEVIDWCQYNPPYSGLWTHIQVIKVMNNIPPVIGELDDVTECSFDANCAGLELDFNVEANDDCSSANSITWKYYIDIDNNNSFDFVSPEIVGAELSFTREFPIGHHRILYSVWDLCGNITNEEQLVNVESCKPPSAKCLHGLSTNLMAMDTDGDGIADWGMVVMQAEMFDGGSSQSCGNDFTLAFSEDPHDVTRIFDCDDIGLNEIELWAIDENGLTDFCVTYVDVQDNNNVCPQGINQTGNISGNISVPNAGKLGGAMVYLDGSNQSGFPTGSDGYFVFPTMPFGGEYEVRPIREGDAKNGVTTLDLVQIQKHLLGLKTFTNPYQYIAADANNSGSVTAIDIIQLRKLILGFYNELPNNKSWRFIDKSFSFPDPNNPWVTTWPETYKINPFINSMNDVDFNAVKVGDLNLNASLQVGSGIILPRSEKKCTIEYEVQATADNNVYRVDLYLLQADRYEALQFSFDWDQRGYSIVDWSPGDNLSMDDFRMPERTGEVASLATYSTDEWPAGRMPLMSMWVRSNSQQPYPFQLYVKKAPTVPVAYEISGDEEVAVQLITQENGKDLLQNRPNPFRDMTTIIMQSNRSEKAVLRVFDLNGKLVHSRDVMLERGENEFILQKSELKNAGIYWYEIASEFQYRTNRMIIVD